MTSLVHVDADGTPAWAVARGGRLYRLDAALADLLALPVEEARHRCEEAADEVVADRVLPPVDRQEVWASGVTYLRSRQGRVEESGHADVYDHVYDAERPELFFKSTAERVVTHGQTVGIRADSDWNVPEAELGLVLTSGGELFGYLPGNDMSSRSIEGDNPLYLPQAKVYNSACALGPEIVPVWEAGDGPFEISLCVWRGDEAVVNSKTSTVQMRRTVPELAGWLFQALEHPYGAVLLTGTGIVPDRRFTLMEGDIVTVSIAGIGEISNPVVTVGRVRRADLTDDAGLMP
ncbi:fumarylacetoacetate hydrolase family protein [Phytoactinopolyspora halotolerans]|uniref:Fumarylacetoacetate hydrolase n=1 Tax=Phytoactinopolyspora halotolerans TaxID=1981512 RepID=A0A6L9SJD2_9ACTN|nr:fumarylacetoacetate hydrolase family protein [Phytoactinopolyspora halotolerans]NEE04180.1 fumarylacetoacetate hydrolase [Phytoactinopolyspora halotolerans]